MWHTWEGITGDVPVTDIVDRVAMVADAAPDHYLRVVVVASHGSGGHINLGRGVVGPGIHTADVPFFAKWKDRVANIWIIACEVAIDKPEFRHRGSLLCGTLAMMSGAYVVASTDWQYRDLLPLPFGDVDDWEGEVRRYEPDNGSVDWTHEYSARWPNLNFLDPVVSPIAVPPHFRESLGGAGSFYGTHVVPWHMAPRLGPPVP